MRHATIASLFLYAASLICAASIPGNAPGNAVGLVERGEQCHKDRYWEWETCYNNNSCSKHEKWYKCSAQTANYNKCPQDMAKCGADCCRYCHITKESYGVAC
ncbi:hypothetical protein IAQ61_008174 [Plenodomus lingam]|uniref:uncharacterized protein n=1 Tax=Leptosphaeria maculans TaxID=5022 RepID=UPI003318B28E|nr:hypothetical protein IAQ61_008174 [Plenodomus lingam]